MELAGFGVRVTLVGPEKLWGESEDFAAADAARVLREIVELDERPTRIIVGSDAYDMVVELDGNAGASRHSDSARPSGPTIGTP